MGHCLDFEVSEAVGLGLGRILVTIAHAQVRAKAVGDLNKTSNHEYDIWSTTHTRAAIGVRRSLVGELSRPPEIATSEL